MWKAPVESGKAQNMLLMHIWSRTVRMGRLPRPTTLAGRLRLRSGAAPMSTYSAKTIEQYRKYAEYSPSPVSLSHFLHFGEKEPESRSYSFLHREIPVRLANMMQEIELLPDELLRQHSCKLIQDFYMLSFGEMIEYENAPTSVETFTQFADTLTKIRDRHSDTVEMMADAVMNVSQNTNGIPEIDAKTQYFLDRLYMSRVSIRMLINQHLMLYGGVLPQEESDIGCISPHCNVAHIVQRAYQNAAFLCDQTYLSSPEMMLDIVNSTQQGLDVIEFVYVPSHLYHILFELFKNALRATIEHHGEDADEYPPVSVLVVQSHQDISIRLSDRGGGVPRQISDNLFHYMYSTAPRPNMDGGGLGQAPMAGLGYGLPLSRLYARYFRGDIALTSLHGYGTDVVVYLRALAEDASEVLPVFNSITKRSYLENGSGGSDWTDPISGFYPRNHRH
eukprot:snap_masked-scaffold55_size446313-processed-gene-1.5 protein:Tk00220 transcript:snap_masked-scaffold55_size446313-processed-gene-1.5-mRNA-1 annotation:"PREDICTED:"